LQHLKKSSHDMTMNTDYNVTCVTDFDTTLNSATAACRINNVPMCVTSLDTISHKAT